VTDAYRHAFALEEDVFKALLGLVGSGDRSDSILWIDAVNN